MQMSIVSDAQDYFMVIHFRAQSHSRNDFESRGIQAQMSDILS